MRLRDSLLKDPDRTGLPHWGRKLADSVVPGFYALVLPTGSSTFWVRYRSPSGRRRQLRLGAFPALTVSKARRLAKEVLSRAELGEDSATTRQRARAMPTWGEWVETYLDRAKFMNRDARHDVIHLRRIESWKQFSLDALTRSDIETARYALAKTRTGATVNRFTAAVRACLSAAVRDGLIDRHPALRLKPFPETPRFRVPSDEEMAVLLKAIREEPDMFARAALMILIQTGTRLSEVLRALWADISLEGGTWRIPRPKAGVPQVIPLSGATRVLLEALPRVSLLVIPGKSGKPRQSLRGPWERVLEKAGLSGAGLRIHDLRRRFGLDVARSSGLHMASKLLRHSSVAVTETHYVPLGIDLLRDAVEKLAVVVPFRSAS